MTNNIILCHPDKSGDPIAEIFGDLPDALLALFDESYEGEIRYVKQHQNFRLSVDIGFRDVRKDRIIRKPDEEYATDLANAVLYEMNYSPDLNMIGFSDPSWSSAIYIALDRWWNSKYPEDVDVSNLPVRLMWLKHRISHTKDDVYYEPKLNSTNDALLHYLTEALGFVWEWEGWDQEPRFIANGLVRVPGTKIVLNLDGEYILSPRCDRCGKKTGFCRCSEDLSEMIEEAGKPHVCNDCYFRQEFEEAKAEYLRTGTIPRDVLDDLRDLAERIANKGSYKGDDWEEVEFDNDVDAIAFLAKAYSGEQVEDMGWYEFIEKNWDVWVEIQEDHLEDYDDGYCECPLGA